MPSCLPSPHPRAGAEGGGGCLTSATAQLWQVQDSRRRLEHSLRSLVSPRAHPATPAAAAPPPGGCLLLAQALAGGLLHPGPAPGQLSGETSTRAQPPAIKASLVTSKPCRRQPLVQLRSHQGLSGCCGAGNDQPLALAGLAGRKDRVANLRTRPNSYANPLAGTKRAGDRPRRSITQFCAHFARTSQA